MAVFNTFTFDGENSLDYGIYITGEAVYNAPERAVEMVSIPGKNGALALDQGRFENIEVTYPAGTFGVEQTEFAGRMRAMRNMLASRYNYVRLTDSYHPDEYRLGLYKSGLEVTPVAMSSAGEFDLTFNCKPQRFLTSGEEPVDTSDLGGDVTTDREPYLLRRSGGGSIGHDFDAEIDKIIGGTVAWNQLVANSGSVSVSVPSGHKYYSNIGGTKAIAISDGSAISATGGTDNIVDLTLMLGSTIADYIYSLEQTTAGAGVAWLKAHGFCTKDYYAYDAGSLLSVKTSEHRTSGKNLLPMSVSEIKARNTSGTWSGNVYTYLGITFTILTDSDDNIIGIQANGTAGSSNSQLRFYISNLYGDYYFNGCPSGGGNSSYNVCMWDEATNARPKKWDGTSASASDFGSGASREVKLVSGHTSELVLRILANATVNNIVFRPMIYVPSVSDATYEPYRINSYPLDSDLELRGLFKLDANNNLYTDGDVYESSGAVTRKYGIVDLGSVDWNYEPGYNRHGFDTRDLSTALKLPSASDIPNVMLSAGKYKITSSNEGWSQRATLTSFVVDVSGYVRIYNDGTADATAFKTAMSGVYLVYELATPTTEQADPFASPQIVDPNGTEEYVDTRDVPIPVGHETKYGMSQLVLTNPTEFPSKPLLEVTGVGTFWLGDTQFTITGTSGQTIYIDCETGEAWKNTGGIITPANGLVTLNRLDFPELDPGDTPVMYVTGITKVVVTPRWWII